MDTLQEHYARLYVSLGWSVIPIVPDTKTPARKWKIYQTERPSLELVLSWIREGYGLALAMGRLSKVIAVDDDRPKHAVNEDHLPIKFFSPLQFVTGSGGVHTLYSYTPGGYGEQYTNFDGKLHPVVNPDLHIDVRAEGSYSVLPPLNGRKWVTEPTAEIVAKLPVLPPSSYNIVVPEKKHQDFNQPFTFTELEELKEGSRNQLLYRAACSLYARQEHSDKVIHSILSTYNNLYGNPPYPDDELKTQIEAAKKNMARLLAEKGQEPKVLTDHLKEEKEPEMTTLALITGTQLQTMHFPEVPWLLSSVVRAHGLNMIVGESGIGKSFLTLSIASAVLSGQGQEGNQVWEGGDITVGSTHRVLLIDRENSMGDIKDHARSMGLTSDSFFVFPDAEKFPLLTKDITPTPESKLITSIIQEHNITLVILDSMVDFFEGDENNSMDATKNIQAWKTIFGPNTCILTIHHLNKPSTTGKLSALHRIRGSSGIAAQAESILGVSASPGDPTLLTVEHIKVRGARKRPKFDLRMQIFDSAIEERSIVTGFKFEGNTVEAVSKKVLAEQEAVAFLKKHPEGVEFQDLYLHLSSLNIGRPMMNQALKNLREQQIIHSVASAFSRKSVYQLAPPPLEL